MRKLKLSEDNNLLEDLQLLRGSAGIVQPVISPLCYVSSRQRSVPLIKVGLAYICCFYFAYFIYSCAYHHNWELVCIIGGWKKTENYTLINFSNSQITINYGWLIPFRGLIFVGNLFEKWVQKSSYLMLQRFISTPQIHRNVCVGLELCRA